MSKEKKQREITPETKVYELLKAYPELEDTLIELVPAFIKLKNPVLRRTIARVTTLAQAAKVGETDLGTLINRLRQETGIHDEFLASVESETAKNRPDWLDSASSIKIFDARPILDKGEHPISIVFEEIRELQPKEVLKLITPFLPVPLIDKIEEAGYKIWSEREGDEFYTYVLGNSN